MTKQTENFRAQKCTDEWLQYRVLYGLCFTLFLGAALMGRLMPASWTGEQGRESIFGEARAKTNATVPMVFSSY